MYIGERDLKKINSNYKIISRFQGGMSNYTYLIQLGENYYVYRYPGMGNDNFVDFIAEKFNINKVKTLNITNADLIYYDEKNGTKITTYIEGKNLDELDENTYKEVSSILEKLHMSEIHFLNNYDHLKRLQKYEKLCENKNMKEYADLKKKWEKIFYFELEKHIKYPCHNDVQISNLIKSEDSLKLIDWEFSAMNDYIYDIASFGNMDFDKALKLLKIYEKELTKSKYIRLYGWGIFQCMQWYNVAKYKHMIGLDKTLDINFNIIAEKYLLYGQKLMVTVSEDFYE